MKLISWNVNGLRANITKESFEHIDEFMDLKLFLNK